MQWGWPAEIEMASMSPAEAASHWLVTDFKLALQDPACRAAQAIAEHGMSPEQVCVSHWLEATHAGWCSIMLQV